MYTVELGIRTESLLNKREHWRTTAARKKRHRAYTTAMLQTIPKPPLPCVCVLTRRSVGTLDKHDNLPSSQKNLVDAIALWLGIDDADERIQWRYEQEKTKRGVFGVRIEFFPAVSIKG